jgi:hypothetical protein
MPAAPCPLPEGRTHLISGTTNYRDHLVLILSPEWVLGELGEVVGTGRPHALSSS